MSKTWFSEMPSNIALIKYMGKKDSSRNIPTNSSISWTLDHLKTRVELEESNGDDVWEALPSEFPFPMSETGRSKFLNHLKRVKEVYGVEASFKVKSANNFPADCGIASSASSFAALTDAACKACEDLSGKSLNVVEKAMLSSQGSGSSCRSFLPGLVQWTGGEILAVDSELKNLSHMVILVGSGTKAVSSSQAHKLVQSSFLFQGRIDRCEKRMQALKIQIQPLDWQGLYENVWAEFWDMHALFESSEPPFGYFLPGTIEVLNQVRKFWQDNGDGPLTTMDAGPNIHLLWREDQSSLAMKFFEQSIKNQWTCLSNLPEVGFAQV